MCIRDSSDRYTEGEGNMTRLTPATWASQQLLFNWLTAPDFIAYNYLTAPRTRTLSLIRKVWHAPCVAWAVSYTHLCWFHYSAVRRRVQ